MRGWLGVGVWIVFIWSAGDGLAQSSKSYGSRPPCSAVTPSPFAGAARGAARGAIVGGIFGSAGRSAAIGAGFVASAPWRDEDRRVPRALAISNAGAPIATSIPARGSGMLGRIWLLLVLCCTACLARPADRGATPEGTVPVAIPTASPVSYPPGSGPTWDVTRVTCGQLLAADDDDRAAATMFYYGYLAASSGIKLIDVSMIDQNVARVMRQCEQSPSLTILQAYDIAFGRSPRP